MRGSGRSVSFAGRCVVAACCALSLLPAAASAGVGASAVPSFPPTVTVGDTGVPASIELSNANSGADSGGTNTVCNAGDPAPCPPGSRGIVLVPSCTDQGPDAACTGLDPGVFAISPTATGEAGTTCAGLVFDVAAADPASGAVRFTPRASHVILPGRDSVCRIAFTFAVLKSPASDYDGTRPGNQTVQVAENAQHFNALPAFSRGSSLGTTVLRARPALATVASPDIALGGQLADTAKLTGLVGTPGGTVDFRLYGPDDATCSGAPVFESLGKPVAADGTAVSDPFTPTASGTYRWRAAYSGDASHEPATGNCNDANENVSVTSPPVVTLGGPPSVTVNTNDTDGPCVKTQFNLRVRVAADGLRSVRVTLDGKTIATSAKARFTVRVRALNLKRGRHTLRIVAVGAGGRTVERATFFRCRRPALPRFVG